MMPTREEIELLFMAWLNDQSEAGLPRSWAVLSEGGDILLMEYKKRGGWVPRWFYAGEILHLEDIQGEQEP